MIRSPIAWLFSIRPTIRALPVYRGTFDDVIGILYVKDLLQHMQHPEDINLQVLLRPAHFVPETKRVSDLLKEFQQRQVQIAIVVDEYGGTAGLVTIEDLLEEIVGEIRDQETAEMAIDASLTGHLVFSTLHTKTRRPR
jgi:CBS domain containing-hemolysin-like protein